MGDAREAEKDSLYADMAKECAIEFGAIVLYTYGGFHASALTFIQRMAKAVDPATLKEYEAQARGQGASDALAWASALGDIASPPRGQCRMHHL